MNEGIIRMAWEKFVCGSDRVKPIRPTVTQSWQRSKDSNVDATSQGAPKLADAELYQRRAASALLANTARLAMQRTGQVLSDAGSMVILTDGSGHIIETLGDHRAIDAGRDVHLEPGGCWDETEIGTNAIGTAVAVRQAVQIHAVEHFCEKVQQWTCAAAPIFHPTDRELLGVIDISGPPQTFSHQNLALVVSMAGHIEEIIGQSVKEDHYQLALRFQEKQRRWTSGDLVAIDRRGAIVCASPEALRNLATQFGPQSETRDLSHLRLLPLDSWQSDLTRRLANTRIELVREGDAELGAIVVFAPKSRLSTARPRHSASGRGLGLTDGGEQKQVQNQLPTEDGNAVESDLPVFGHAPGSVANFVATDARVKEICNTVASAARIRLPVSICGQTGTGKEELARFAHVASGRKGAFVPVNCTALPDSLIEAELFGYADGAFTGARKGGARGLVREAHGGTLFLDEIGDMPFALQSVLLRFLDDHMVRPIGGSSSKVDVFIVSATNVDLGQAVLSKRFRTDLLYRLNTVNVVLPALAERSDFVEIALHLLTKIDPSVKITSKALASLSSRPWPGNIRELRSVLMRLSLAAANHGNLIDGELVAASQPAAPAPAQVGTSLRDLQRAKMLQTYSETGGNISETARRLNVCRNTVYRALNDEN